MICATCVVVGGPRAPLWEGQRVTVSRWEQVWLSQELIGTIEQLGHPDTLRRGTAKVRWDNSHKNRWWPVSALIPVAQGEQRNA